MRLFTYRWTCVPPRYWHHWWHWRYWTLTRFRRNDGTPVGTWQLWLGPLILSRDLRLLGTYVFPPRTTERNS
jgi:hypothetical protein